jgi:hypothetical protein
MILIMEQELRLLLLGQTAMQIVVQGRDSLLDCKDTTAMEGYSSHACCSRMGSVSK